MPLSARAAFTEARELLRLFVKAGRPQHNGKPPGLSDGFCLYCNRLTTCAPDCLFERAVRLVASLNRKQR